jgi:hypothetical protein
VSLDEEHFGSLECSQCGATTEARCGCGVTYVPAGTRATAAVAASPEKSNRAIAAATGLSEATVRRARVAGATNDAAEKRVGKDGRKYPATTDTLASIRAKRVRQWQVEFNRLSHDAIKLAADWDREPKQFAVSQGLLESAKQAADALAQLVAKIEKESGGQVH